MGRVGRVGCVGLVGRVGREEMVLQKGYTGGSGAELGANSRGRLWNCFTKIALTWPDAAPERYVDTAPHGPCGTLARLGGLWALLRKPVLVLSRTLDL